MKVGIIGCGYVGKAIARLLRSKGYFVSVSTRKGEHIAELQDIANHVYLLQHPQDLRELVKHQETIILAVAPGPADTYQSTYLETASSLAQIALHAPYLKHIVYTSSVSVYGEQGGKWVNEETLCLPSNTQTDILQKTEQALLAINAPPLKVCILRLGQIYGPGREVEERLRKIQGTTLPGSGDSYTNLSSLFDIVEGIYFSIQHHLSGIYNLCEDLHIPRKQFFDFLCQKNGIPPLQWNPQLSSVHGGNKRVDSSKIRSLGFSFNNPLSYTFSFKDYLSNPLNSVF